MAGTLFGTNVPSIPLAHRGRALENIPLELEAAGIPCYRVLDGHRTVGMVGIAEFERAIDKVALFVRGTDAWTAYVPSHRTIVTPTRQVVLSLGGDETRPGYRIRWITNKVSLSVGSVVGLHALMTAWQAKIGNVYRSDSDGIVDIALRAFEVDPSLAIWQEREVE